MSVARPKKHRPAAGGVREASPVLAAAGRAAKPQTIPVGDDGLSLKSVRSYLFG